MDLNQRNLEYENDKLLIEFMEQLRDKNMPNTISELPSIRNAAIEKINSINDYCKKRGVYYFSELPISGIINSRIMNDVETGIFVANSMPQKEDVSKKLYIPKITSLFLYVKSVKKEMVFDTIYNDIDNLELEKIYRYTYLKYYDSLIASESDETLKEMLEKDIEISKKLGLSEEFMSVKEYVDGLIERRNSICKQNVYKPN